MTRIYRPQGGEAATPKISASWAPEAVLAILQPAIDVGAVNVTSKNELEIAPGPRPETFGSQRKVGLLGREIRRLRTERKLSLEETAACLGLEAKGLALVERGAAAVGLETLFRLLEVFEAVDHEQASGAGDQGAKRDSPDSMSDDGLREHGDRLEELLARMQGPDARKARCAAFDASPEDLGEAALAEARRSES